AVRASLSRAVEPFAPYAAHSQLVPSSRSHSGAKTEDDVTELQTTSNGISLASRPQPFSTMALNVRRTSRSVVGRPAELAAIQQEIESARAGRLVALTLEGEPGIGKTRLLMAAGQRASDEGFTTIDVTADEEIRGLFM